MLRPADNKIIIHFECRSFPCLTLEENSLYLTQTEENESDTAEEENENDEAEEENGGSSNLPQVCPTNTVLIGFRAHRNGLSSMITIYWEYGDTLLGRCRILNGFEVDEEKCDTLGVTENRKWPGKDFENSSHKLRNFIYCPENYVAIRLIKRDGVVWGMTCCPLAVVD